MARRLGQSQNSPAFPPNTIYLDFPRSDGDESRWPTNTTRIVDSDGQVNFMQYLDPEENIYARRWRASVGKAIAAKLEMEGDHNNYVLRSWPQGYQFYDHHKGLADAPRHDIYLYGYRGGRFRSINEFVPHAIWLYSDPTMNYSNCDCKYCTKQPQKGITASMGEILGTPSAASPRVRRDRPRKPRNYKPYAAVQKVLEPVKTLKASSHVQPESMLAERDSDLRAVFSQNTMKLKRWYRDGEVVWCELPTRITGPSTSSSDIVYWPGIVREYKFTAKPIPINTNQRTSELTSSVSSSSQIVSGSLEDGRGVILDKQNPTPFKVQQSTVYLIDLLAINKPMHFPDTKVFPYQAYVPPEALIRSLQSVPIPLLDFDHDNIATFNPLSNDPPIRFDVATSPYAAALEIGSKLCRYFSVSDEWEFSYTTPTLVPARTPTVPFPNSTQNLGDGSIESAISLAHRANASMTPATFNASVDPFQSISSTQLHHSQAQLGQLAKNVLGPSPTPGKARTQIRFQGLWWGPERIWVDDFVRLKPLRRCIAPYGAQNIVPPASPSKSVLEICKTNGVDPSEAGAGIRGCFLQIGSLFVVETVEDGKKKRECRASGMLYELVDEDWVEEEDETLKKYKLQMEGKAGGKENSISIEVASSSTQRPTSTQVNVSSSTQTQTQKQISTSTNMSQPPFNYLLPKPSKGYRFRPVITPGYEIAVSFSMIAGRYYPGLLNHPLIAHEVTLALKGQQLAKRSHLWALEGLGGGFHCSVDPVTFVMGRFKMFELADKLAYEQLELMKKTELARLTVKREEGDQDIDMLLGSDDEDRMIRNAKKAIGGYDGDGDVSMG